MKSRFNGKEVDVIEASELDVYGAANWVFPAIF